jgi:phage terminase large subunit-like protein
MSPDQTRMIDDPHPLLWVGTGTKTGKTVAGAQWIIEGIALGDRCAWVGPWFKRTRTGWEHVAGAFKAAKLAGLVRSRDDEMRLLLPASGGVLECFSGDNPDSIFGEAFNRVFVDEAGRQPPGVLSAVTSTTTATNGRIKVAFNLDRGRRHWAIAGLLAARSGDDPAQGWITLKTSQSPYVPAEAIERARRTLPAHVFAALYDAEIQDDGATVFRGIEGCIAGELEPYRQGFRYVIGVDLARKVDWTVACVVCVETRHVVAWERSHGLPWHEQRRRIKALAEAYHGARCVVDATGVGDPNVEELVRDGVRVDPFVFTGPSKRDLVESLIVAVEQRRVTFPRIEALVSELEVFEYEQRPSGLLSYNAPDGYHDDCVMALALAVNGLPAVNAPGVAASAVRVGRGAGRGF